MKSMPIISRVGLFITNFSIFFLILLTAYTSWKVYKMLTLEPPQEVVHYREKEESVTFNGYTFKKIASSKKTEDGVIESKRWILETPTPEVSTAVKTDQKEILGETDEIKAHLISGKSTIGYTYLDETKGIRALIVFLIIYYGLLIFSFYWLLILRRLVLSISQKVFFSTDNARRLIILSAPAFFLPILKYIATAITENFYIQNFTSPDGFVRLKFIWDPLPFIFGLILLLMAGIIYEGRTIKEEQDLTI